MARRSRVAVAVLFLGAGCVGEAAPRPLTVFAASSLSEAFEALGDTFTEAEVAFNFAGSQQIVTQAQQGATADVIATADEPTMSRVAGDLEDNPRIFAHNRLQIVVGEGNPKGVRGLADLSRPGLVVVFASPEVPAGRYAQQALAKAGVVVEAASLEQNVRQVVGKVALGEADAGIVYATDVRGVDGVDIPDEHNVRVAYPIGVLRGARDEARAFVELVLSGAGQDTLAAFGFGPA
jgi:molybdate transport system substrate-binding protein